MESDVENERYLRRQLSAAWSKELPAATRPEKDQIGWQAA